MEPSIRSLALAAFLALIASTSSAQAPARVVVTKPTYLFVTPKIQPQALAAVEPGAELELLGEAGDWYQVAYQHPTWGRRVGFLPREAVVVVKPVAPVSERPVSPPAGPGPESSTPVSQPARSG